MKAVTLSATFEIVIPKEIRESMNLHPGDKVKFVEFDGRVELVQIQPMRKLFGIAKGIDTTIERDEDRV